MRSQSRVFEKAVFFPCLNIKSVIIRGFPCQTEIRNMEKWDGILDKLSEIGVT